MIRHTNPVLYARRVLRSARAHFSNERGDTLVEALAALLIAALGAALLATMVMVSTNVVAQTRSIQAANFDAESQTYAQEGTSLLGSVASISAGGVTQSVPVIVYTSDNGTFARYVEGRGY